ELVEIGGSFRVPDVMQAANVRLVEVGATNRTRIGDYERAISAQTGLLMKVHSSNFKLVGFTEEVPMPELAQLGRERAIPTAFDLGSGRLEADGATALDMLGGETLVREAVESGIEVVSFSGDKLLGGPQAGLIVGTRERMASMRRNPIYRAMRLDKAMLAGLEGTLELLLCGRGDEIPTRSMLVRPAAEVRAVAESIARDLSALAGITASAVDSESEPGSGAAPGEYLPSAAVRVAVEGLSADGLADVLRASDPPVFARIAEGSLMLDPRTLLPGDREDLLKVFASLAS
ncbi:MAG: L-seryl-tRNA(Sec) selenium transferase, partial [Planctomycetota bacterium]|nr:L-seryl-tRNA(Sec) selenium transferase [Planctomycetota bacterium]